jgi:hypothetical protein
VLCTEVDTWGEMRDKSSLVADNVFILLSPRTMGKMGALHGLNDACELKCGVAYGRWTRAEIARRQEEKIWVRYGWAYVF